MHLFLLLICFSFYFFYNTRRSRESTWKRSYTEESLYRALEDIISGQLGTRRAAVIYGIPRSTLRNKVYKLDNQRGTVGPGRLPGRRPKNTSDNGATTLLANRSTSNCNLNSNATNNSSNSGNDNNNNNLNAPSQNNGSDGYLSPSPSGSPPITLLNGLSRKTSSPKKSNGNCSQSTSPSNVVESNCTNGANQVASSISALNAVISNNNGSSSNNNNNNSSTSDNKVTNNSHINNLHPLLLSKLQESNDRISPNSNGNNAGNNFTASQALKRMLTVRNSNCNGNENTIGDRSTPPTNLPWTGTSTKHEGDVGVGNFNSSNSNANPLLNSLSIMPLLMNNQFMSGLMGAAAAAASIASTNGNQLGHPSTSDSSVQQQQQQQSLLSNSNQMPQVDPSFLLSLIAATAQQQQLQQQFQQSELNSTNSNGGVGGSGSGSLDGNMGGPNVNGAVDTNASMNPLLNPALLMACLFNESMALALAAQSIQQQQQLSTSATPLNRDIYDGNLNCGQSSAALTSNPLLQEYFQRLCGGPSGVASNGMDVDLHHTTGTGNIFGHGLYSAESDETGSVSSEPMAPSNNYRRHTGSTTSNLENALRGRTVNRSIGSSPATSKSKRGSLPDIGNHCENNVSNIDSTAFGVGGNGNSLTLNHHSFSKLPSTASLSGVTTGVAATSTTNSNSSNNSGNGNSNNNSNNSNNGKIRPKRGRYRNYEREALDKAVAAVRSGEMTVHRAGTYFGVPHSTLEYKVKQRHLLRTGDSSNTNGLSPSSTSSSKQRPSSASSSSTTSSIANINTPVQGTTGPNSSNSTGNNGSSIDTNTSSLPIGSTVIPGDINSSLNHSPKSPSSSSSLLTQAPSQAMATDLPAFPAV